MSLDLDVWVCTHASEITLGVAAFGAFACLTCFTIAVARIVYWMESRGNVGRAVAGGARRR